MHIADTTLEAIKDEHASEMGQLAAQYATTNEPLVKADILGQAFQKNITYRWDLLVNGLKQPYLNSGIPDNWAQAGAEAGAGEFVSILGAGVKFSRGSNVVGEGIGNFFEYPSAEKKLVQGAADAAEVPQVVINNQVGNSFDVYVESTKLKGVAKQDLLAQQERFATPDVVGRNYVKPDYSIYDTNGKLAAIGDAKTSSYIPFDEQAQGFLKAAETTTSKTIIYYTPTGKSTISQELLDAAAQVDVKIIQVGVN